MNYRDWGRSEEARLDRLIDISATKSSNASRQRSERQNELAQGRTQFFEKLALGYGAALAAFVSFLGARHQAFHPTWLFRTTLIAMIATMFFAVVRNWIYPKYVSALFGVYDFKASLEQESARAERFNYSPALSLETGRPLDVDTWMAKHRELEAVLHSKIKEFERDQRRAWKMVKILENACLMTGGFAALCLTILALLNF